jgi:hypothetical protein
MNSLSNFYAFLSICWLKSLENPPFENTFPKQYLSLLWKEDPLPFHREIREPPPFDTCGQRLTRLDPPVSIYELNYAQCSNKIYQGKGAWVRPVIVFFASKWCYKAKKLFIFCKSLTQFIVSSDNYQWCAWAFGNRSDVTMANAAPWELRGNEQEAIFFDLAVLSKCNHSVTRKEWKSYTPM